jgi:uncharacterized protein YecT (DUF1311 family)
MRMHLHENWRRKSRLGNACSSGDRKMRPTGIGRTGAIVLASLAYLLPAPAHPADIQLPWQSQGVRCSAPAEQLLLTERVICADPELHRLDLALAATYGDLAQKATSAQVRSVVTNDSDWFLAMHKRCGLSKLDQSMDPTTTDATAKTCLQQHLLRRIDAVKVLSLTPPDHPYILSAFERAMLKDRGDDGFGVINDISMRLRRNQDALSLGLPRVFSLLLSHNLTGYFDWMKGSPLHKFLWNTTIDGGSLQGRYFVDTGSAPHNGGVQSMFIADLDTGEVSLAMIDPLPPSAPRLLILEMACASTEFKEFSERRMRAFGKDWEKFDIVPGRPEPISVAETIRTSSCK